MNFTRSGLEGAGFVGWLPVAGILPKLNASPPVPGVYVVTYSSGKPNDFIEKSSGGWYKRKRPHCLK